MKRPTTTLVLVVVSFTSFAGCIRGLDSGRHEFVRFCEPIDRAQTFSANRTFAKKVWNTCVGKNCQCNLSKHYSNGFVDGYADYLNLGGNGEPLVPPPKYWKSRFRTVEGRRLTEQYLNGFRHGASLAMQAGRELALIHASPIIDSYQVIKAMPPGTCFLASQKYHPVETTEFEESIASSDAAFGFECINRSDTDLVEEPQTTLLSVTEQTDSSSADMEAVNQVAQGDSTTGAHRGNEKRSKATLASTTLAPRSTIIDDEMSSEKARFQVVSHGSKSLSKEARARESVAETLSDSPSDQFTLGKPIVTDRDTSASEHGLTLLARHLFDDSESTPICDTKEMALDSRVAPLPKVEATDSTSKVARKVVLFSSRRTHRNPK